MTRKFNLTLLLILVCSTFAFAQKEKDRVINQVYDPLPSADEVVSKKYKKNHDEWKEGKYPFPGKPKDMWSVGIMAGAFYVSGDVAGLPNWGAGLQVRKSLGYAASLRGSYFYGNASGLSYKPSSGPAVTFNAALNNTQGVGYLDYFYYNYQTVYHQASLDVLFNLNNVLFHQRRNVFAPYVGIGLGMNMYTTKYDALNASGGTYETQFAALPLPGDPGYGDRATVREELRNILDGDYETLAEQNEGFNIQVGDNVLNPTLNISAGIDIRLSKRLSLTIGHQAFLTISDDLVDGKQWSEQGDLTRQMDVPHFTSIGLNFALGSKKKRVEPKWFVNPNNESAEKLAKHEEKIKELGGFLVDDDKDNVPNALDKEANTPAGSEVNVRGETLDSDEDGVPNHLDKEKFSPPGFPVDPNTGVAQQPKYVTQPDVIRVGDERYLKKEDYKGGNGGSGTLNDWYLPMIHFDLNKFAIKPEFSPELKYVATVAQKYPKFRIVVHGHTDVRNTDCYNDKLSFQRAQAAIDYMVKNYNLPRAQFVLKYGGEKENLVKGAASESSHYLNRRVEFSVAAEGDKDMVAPTCNDGNKPTGKVKGENQGENDKPAGGAKDLKKFGKE